METVRCTTVHQDNGISCWLIPGQRIIRRLCAHQKRNLFLFISLSILVTPSFYFFPSLPVAVPFFLFFIFLSDWGVEVAESERLIIESLNTLWEQHSPLTHCISTLPLQDSKSFYSHTFFNYHSCWHHYLFWQYTFAVQFNTLGTLKLADACLYVETA